MGIVFNLMKAIKNAIPVIMAKIASTLLFIFAVGMVFGYWLSTIGYASFVLLIPFIAIAVMWYKLDEGALVFIVLMGLALFFPEIFVI